MQMHYIGKLACMPISEMTCSRCWLYLHIPSTDIPLLLSANQHIPLHHSNLPAPDLESCCKEDTQCASEEDHIESLDMRCSRQRSFDFGNDFLRGFSAQGTEGFPESVCRIKICQSLTTRNTLAQCQSCWQDVGKHLPCSWASFL